MQTCLSRIVAICVPHCTLRHTYFSDGLRDAADIHRTDTCSSQHGGKQKIVARGNDGHIVAIIVNLGKESGCTPARSEYHQTFLLGGRWDMWGERKQISHDLGDLFEQKKWVGTSLGETFELLLYLGVRCHASILGALFLGFARSPLDGIGRRSSSSSCCCCWKGPSIVLVGDTRRNSAFQVTGRKGGGAIPAEQPE